MYQRWISVGTSSDGSADTCSTAKSIHCDSVYRKMRVKRSDVWLSILFFLIGFTGSQGANNGSRKAGITIEHSANPPEAAKCTPVTLTCRLVLDDQEAEVDVWWTFRGENATKLPNVTIDSDPSKRVWELHLLCPTVEHDGNYDCNAHSWSETELVYRKEATVKVYVPTSVEVGQNETYEELGAAVNLTCLGYGFPQTSMTWYKNEELLRPEEGRLDVEVTSLNKETLFGLVMIYSLLREDNGTYKCKIENNHGMSAASQDILILEPPEVSVDSVDPLDSRTALLRWHVRYRGNLPVKRFHLQVKNFSTGADWLDVDDKIPPNATTYTVRYLAPAMTYGFQLAAVNDAGPSEWEIMNVTMPADVPPKVSWVHLLASTNETLLFGWRRPNHDNGANITNYEVWLTKNGQLYTNGTLAVSQLGRTNYMYVFVSLEPGEPYSFQVQACSVLGCGNRSDPLDAVTSDGFADPPENVETTCVNASSESPSYVIITWSFPKNSRGTLQGFNVSLDSQTKYRNLNGNIIVENFKEFIDVKGKTLTTKYIIKPNTQYTVRVCSVNKAGCGLQSTVTNKTTCASAPSVPTSVPQLQLQRLKKEKDCKQLKLELSRVSERNGFIWCYRIIIVKLRKGDTLLNLPSDPQNMNISTYAEVHKSDKSSAYVAEAFSRFHVRLYLVGLVYLFNLIVGTGALTMPAAFSHSGWLLSLIILVVISFMSFLTVTFVIEAMAVANAMVHWRTVKHIKKVINEEDRQLHAINPSRQELVDGLMKDEIISNSIEHDEKVPLLLSNSMESITDSSAVEYYNITESIELGKMASLFFNKIGVNLFYFCIAIYLYGDLSIYAAAVSKSLRDVSCNYVPGINGCNISYDSSDPCWTTTDAISRKDAYRIYLCVFLCLLGPFVFFNVQKTKYLQMLTSFMRWLAFGSMITLAAIALAQGKGRGSPGAVDFDNMPNLIGVCVYSFMCHHSLPSLITPIRNKKSLNLMILSDFILILAFYSLLCFTGIFAFDYLEDMYTLNFQPDKCKSSYNRIIIAVPFLQYFLALFPVFTLSTSFPIIAITLRNNLKSLCLKETRQYSFFLGRILFPLVTIIPPILVAFATEDLDFLVGITGSYAGAVIQYIVPALLVYYARKDALLALGLGVKNKHTSPFRHSGWIYFVLLWAATCIIFVTVNHIITKK